MRYKKSMNEIGPFRYLARHICVGSDGVCLHRDLFDYPLFDRGVKPVVTLPAKSRHRF
jgi:hypothetical protein